MIVKLGNKRYRNQFFYKGYQQYGTGIEEYDDIFNCTLTLLQVQADHEAKEQGQADKPRPATLHRYSATGSLHDFAPGQ